MDVQARIERALERALSYAAGNNGQPKQLVEAMRYSVFPGGARVRPRLCLAVAYSCGDPAPEASDAAAAAIELLHCASLVHDDMPCFDNADLRRGKPTVHEAFGEPLALLAGDALIVLAFETIARECATVPERIGPLISTLGRSVGMPYGIVAGQAWESEPEIVLEDYHRAKTTALFSCATTAGAIAAGSDPQVWYGVGDALGNAYQVADDLRDAVSSESELGKPIGQDERNCRPNAVAELGIEGALARLVGHVQAAVDAIPPCPGSAQLEQLIKSEAKRLRPKSLAQNAA
ncbi:polyprenyl synthetase family protein [Rhodobium gokarnense]|uniref:Geranylgeranyl diphosphate synthase type II n=1 Tax=Rhodobium gokarnense TaxID=364296 RepID=A0ABT3HBH7_9HYPH|nr:polyprenyl synthetase family protein [Rhodobium gokarnense]MCW2307763.1 geranylgeranyl diphosphate synthase type II [Rhodobium gokarnense]